MAYGQGKSRAELAQIVMKESCVGVEIEDYAPTTVSHSLTQGPKKYKYGFGGTKVQIPEEMDLMECNGLDIIEAVFLNSNFKYFTNPLIDFSKIGVQKNPPEHLINLAAAIHYYMKCIPNATSRLPFNLLMDVGLKIRADRHIYIINSKIFKEDEASYNNAMLWNSVITEYARESGAEILDIGLFFHTTTIEELSRCCSRLHPATSIQSYDDEVDLLLHNINKLTPSTISSRPEDFLSKSFREQVESLCQETKSPHLQYFLENCHLDSQDFVKGLEYVE